MEDSAKEGRGVVVRIVAMAAAAVKVVVRGCLEDEMGRRGLDDGGGCGGFDGAVDAAAAAEEEEMADGGKRVAMAFWIMWLWFRYPNGMLKRRGAEDYLAKGKL